MSHRTKGRVRMRWSAAGTLLLQFLLAGVLPLGEGLHSHHFQSAAEWHSGEEHDHGTTPGFDCSLFHFNHTPGLPFPAEPGLAASPVHSTSSELPPFTAPESDIFAGLSARAPPAA